MTRPTFALVIPTFRRPSLVLQAVDSALRQSRAFDEIIVVADGEDDPALRHLSLRPISVVSIAHSGVAGARNAGIDHASADWVCFLDDDDLLHPEYLAHLEEQVRANPDVGAYNSQYWSFAAVAGPREEIIATSLDECLAAAEHAVPKNDMTYLEIEGRSFDLLLERLRGSMSTASVRRDILRKAGGFPEGFPIAEDWTMYVNVARHTEWRVLRERLAFFRDHPDVVTRAPSPAKGVMVLRAIAAFWDTGDRPVPPHRPLQAYRRHYRYELRQVLERCRRQRDIAHYRAALKVAAVILPRRRDRALAMVPTVLWERLRCLRSPIPRH